MFECACVCVGVSDRTETDRCLRIYVRVCVLYIDVPYSTSERPKIETHSPC